MHVRYKVKARYGCDALKNARILKVIGANIIRVRKDKNISASKLSLKVGRSASYINKVENGKINISLKMIIAISEALNIDICELFKE